MAQNLETERTARTASAADDLRGDIMKECLRKAAEIRRGLEGRHHSDSTELIAEDRKR
jgi:hypothetical protein